MGTHGVTDHNTRGKWVRKAREIQDLQGLESRNSKFKGLAAVLDSEGTRRMRRGLGLSVDRLAALKGAQCGDVVVNAQARYRNGGNAECPCGEAVETRQHLFWECPRWENARRQIRGNHGNPQVDTMAALTAEFGLGCRRSGLGGERWWSPGRVARGFRGRCTPMALRSSPKTPRSGWPIGRWSGAPVMGYGTQSRARARPRTLLPGEKLRPSFMCACGRSESVGSWLTVRR